MYELESYEDFKKLIEELDEKYRLEEDDWSWGMYSKDNKILYEGLKKYVAEHFPDEEEKS